MNAPFEKSGLSPQIGRRLASRWRTSRAAGAPERCVQGKGKQGESTAAGTLKVFKHWEQGDATRQNDTKMPMIRQRNISIRTERDAKMCLKYA